MGSKKISSKIDDTVNKANGANAAAGVKANKVVVAASNAITDATRKADQIAQKGGHRVQEVAEKVSHVVEEIADKAAHVAHETAQKVIHRTKE